MEKGRCADIPALFLLRRMTAHVLAMNLKFRVRWLPSELNPSDWDSRLKDDEWVPSVDASHKSAPSDVAQRCIVC